MPWIALGQLTREAAEYYTTTFPNSRIIHEDADGIEVTLCGTSCKLLFENPTQKITTALSYFLYCGSEALTDRLYESLPVGGKIILPLGAYPWTAKYAWIEDRFGVSWHLDADDIRVEQKIVPTFVFDEKNDGIVRKVTRHYVNCIPNSRLLMEFPRPAQPETAESDLIFAQCKLNGLVANVMISSVPQASHFSEANMLCICADTEEHKVNIQRKLTGSGAPQQCRHPKDPFGVSWAFIISS